VATAPIISRPEAERLRRLQQHSPALQRRALVERLALEPEALTPELVIWGEQWAGAAERLACLLEPELAARLDLQRLQAITPQNAAPLPFDQTYRAQRSRAAALIGLETFIEAFPFHCRLWDRTPSTSRPPPPAVASVAAIENRSQLGRCNEMLRNGAAPWPVVPASLLWACPGEIPGRSLAFVPRAVPSLLLSRLPSRF
jgi:hypothetical protein